MADDTPASGPWTKYQQGSPSPAASDEIGPWTHYQQPRLQQDQTAGTTARGITGAAVRGATRALAPEAIGAGIGAAIGAPTGVGVFPGAAFGAGAGLLTDLVSKIYNPLAQQFGWPQTPSIDEATDRVLDFFGAKRPTTPVERGIEAVTQGAVGAAAPAGAASAAAETAVGPFAKGVLERFGERPLTQAIQGATGAAAGQTAAEYGYGPWTQLAASAFGGMLPAPSAVRTPWKPIEPTQAAIEAHQAGYVLSPAMMADKPGFVPSGLAGWGGKIKTQQSASVRNQELSNELAVQALGLPKGTQLSHRILQDVRNNAGQAYADVARAIPSFLSDQAYRQIVANLGNRTSRAAQLVPSVVNNAEIDALSRDLTNIAQWTPSDALEVVKQLRFDSNANFRVRDNPAKLRLALAQREAADAVDDLMERAVTASGQPDVIAKYKAARQQIARTYDIGAALNGATGDVGARRLLGLAARGRPLGAELETIAKTAEAFPKAMQMPSAFGGDEAFSALDFFAGMAAAAAGHPEATGLIFGRPIARGVTLSRPVQSLIMRGAPGPFGVASGIVAGEQPRQGGISPYVTPGVSAFFPTNR